MQNAPLLNLGPSPHRLTEHVESSPVEGEFHSDDSFEQTRSEIRGVRLLLHQQQEEHDHRMRMFSMILGVLILVFFAALWLMYPTIRDEKGAMAETLGLKTTTGSLNERMNAVEGNVGKMTAGLPALVDQFQTNMKSSLQTAQDQAAQVEKRIQGEVNQSLQGIQNRVAGVESTQKEAREHVNQLQTQIAQLNSELVSVREQASSSAAELKQLKEDQANSTQNLSGLNERVVASQAAISTLTAKVDRKRIDFRASNQQKLVQVTPDIDFTLKHIDAGKQQVDAVLDLGGKNGDLPIRGQGVRKPVLFYMPDGKRQVELVITEVTKDAVSGYLLMPASKDSK